MQFFPDPDYFSYTKHRVRLWTGNKGTASEAPNILTSHPSLPVSSKEQTSPECQYLKLPWLIATIYSAKHNIPNNRRYYLCQVSKLILYLTLLFDMDVGYGLTDYRRLTTIRFNTPLFEEKTKKCLS